MNLHKLNNKNMSAFKMLRDKLKMSQTDFAKELEVTVATLSRWENGWHEPALNMRQIKSLNHLLTKARLSFYDLPDEIVASTKNNLEK